MGSSVETHVHGISVDESHRIVTRLLGLRDHGSEENHERVGAQKGKITEFRKYVALRM
jgi:hypothetical protein